MILRLLFKGLAVAALLAVFAAPALYVTGQSAGATWSAPITLGTGWWQSVAVDMTGTAHVGWYGTVPESLNSDVLYYTARPLNGTFDEPVDVIYTGDGGYTVRNALAVTDDGMLHAVYRGGTAHFFASAPVSGARQARNWSTPVQIDDGYYVTMMADRDNVLHAISSAQGVNLRTLEVDASAVQLEQDPCAFCADLIYRRSTDGGKTWSQPRNISNTFDGSEKMSIWQAESGRLYIQWDEGFDWYIGRGDYDSIRIVYSDDGGLNWSEPIIVRGNGLPFMGEAIDYGNGNLLVVWREARDADRSIHFQTTSDDGQTWSEPGVVPGLVANNAADSVLDDYELIRDRAGIVHLFAVGVTPENPDSVPGLYHVEFRQGRWQRPTLVYFDPRIRRPEWPQAVVGPQNDIHLTWFIRFGARRIAGESGLAVMYSYRTPTQPERPTQEFRPTEAVQPTATVIAQFAPTLTPFPTAVPIQGQANVRTTSDLYAIQTLLSGLFVGAVLCGGILFILGFRPRRR